MKHCRRIVSVIGGLFLLIGCATPQIASPGTPTVLPTPLSSVQPTPTTISLTAADLEPLLVQPGDLPGGRVGGQVRDTIPAIIENLPSSQQTILQTFEQAGRVDGWVGVRLYQKTTNADAAYQEVVQQMPLYPSATNTKRTLKTVDTLGEQATAAPPPDIATTATYLTFVRCHAFIVMTFSDDVPDPEATAAIAYAKRLDKRIQPVVCQ